jgi:hypothetical protein
LCTGLRIWAQELWVAKTQYRPCAFDGVFHHPDELIYVPEGVPREKQKRLCLDHAEMFLKHLIAREECNYGRSDRRKRA